MFPSVVTVTQTTEMFGLIMTELNPKCYERQCSQLTKMPFQTCSQILDATSTSNVNETNELKQTLTTLIVGNMNKHLTDMAVKQMT